ncbi:Six-hairpin glycosidase, partial [Dendrothele bispora CBS 962.96]
MILLAALLFSVPVFVVGRAPAGPWDDFNYAPKTRVVVPASVRNVEGDVDNAGGLLLDDGSDGAEFTSSGSWVTLDFGKEVGGLVSLTFDSITPGSSSISLSFSESPEFIRPDASDDSSFPDATTTYDGVLRVPSEAISEGLWTQDSDSLRAGFRFLTIVSNSDDPLKISNVSCEISFMPHVDDMTAYTGYFYAKDPGFEGDEDFLTKLWYAGAYTVQTNTVPVNTGRMVPFAPRGTWANNATLGVAGPIIVDGAKRDRAVWPGDMGIAVPTQFVSTLDLLPTKNALSTMFSHINPTTGALPESGPPLSQLGSDTYHMWTLIGTHNYYLYSGDIEWIEEIWGNYTKAVAFLEGKVGSVGLMNVTGLRDWARQGGGGINAEGNAILYKTLLTATDLANAMNETSLASAWTRNATNLKSRFNDVFWMEDVGMYRDNSSTTLAPQDANSFAILFNVTETMEQKQRVSDGLMNSWNDLGPLPPELPDTISPFISGFELQAHFEAGNDNRALDLLHRTWGYMLYTNLSVQSTLLEGFTANGSLAYRANVGYNHDPAYTSHAHGWSSGPTSALTIYVLGLSVTAVQGSEWLLSPHVGSGGMTAAEGGFETALGWFGANWTLGDNGSQSVAIEVTTPEGTSGMFVVPAMFDEGAKVMVDGEDVVVQNSQVGLSGGHHLVVV